MVLSSLYIKGSSLQEKKKSTLEGEQIAGPILLYEQLCCHGTINPFKIGQWEQGCGSRLLARGRD